MLLLGGGGGGGKTDWQYLLSLFPCTVNTQRAVSERKGVGGEAVDRAGKKNW